MSPCIAFRFVPVLFAITTGLAACSDSSGPRSDGGLEVRAFARGLALQTQTGEAEVTAVRIDRVLLVLGRVKLEKAADGTADFVDERSVVVALNPGGEPVLAVSANIPSGTYKELELAFDKLQRGHPQEDPLIVQYPGLANASVLIEGTRTRGGVEERFAFASDLDMDVEVQFLPPLSVVASEAAPTLLSLVLDLNAWFRDGSGRLLDPVDPANRSTIEGNVQRSIELFEDSERDGR